MNRVVVSTAKSSRTSTTRPTMVHLGQVVKGRITITKPPIWLPTQPHLQRPIHLPPGYDVNVVELIVRLNCFV
jgi:hypothetical protein